LKILILGLNADKGLDDRGIDPSTTKTSKVLISFHSSTQAVFLFLINEKARVA